MGDSSDSLLGAACLGSLAGNFQQVHSWSVLVRGGSAHLLQW